MHTRKFLLTAGTIVTENIVGLYQNKPYHQLPDAAVVAELGLPGRQVLINYK